MDESPTKRAILEFLKTPGNDTCADCGRKGKYDIVGIVILYICMRKDHRFYVIMHNI